MSDHWFMTDPIREIPIDRAGYCINKLRDEVRAQRTERWELDRQLKELKDELEQAKKPFQCTKRYWDALDRIRREGCGNSSPLLKGSSVSETCREKCPGEPEDWCWSCQAHEALNPK